ncbi:hypothetical protein B0I08_103200 [Glaciihabitans tibetensis]|uniref:Uncharacterized protein n=1 Tax=Glaciihabitans tibetensis TaxID=1266600 RepID=A0A2T0VG12_9MICO|nr:hypothetical protein [Glaciihabitans tibetensis]PRY68994.1 hypothetical protein B0I08_103200 [Glaciihabitans tibetensis]
MTNLTPGVRNVMHCDAFPGETCLGHGAGHELLPLQERVIAATPSKWRDGLVQSVSAEGWIAVDLLDAPLDGSTATVWAWNHTDRVATLPIGSPVAVHAVYHALAIGPERVNVLIALP